MSDIENGPMASFHAPTFVEGLQGFASMCERSLSIEDGPMLAAKFRDCAFVIDMLQKLRDQLRGELAEAKAQRDEPRLRDDRPGGFDGPTAAD